MQQCVHIGQGQLPVWPGDVAEPRDPYAEQFVTVRRTEHPLQLGTYPRFGQIAQLGP